MLNCTFSSGIVPDSWLLRNIKPINKNKGNPLNPKHFRPITILSWFGKHFTSILLKRLNHYSEQFSVLGESQLLWNIKPINKNKGDPLNPKHVRPNTILSCFCKHFTSILLKRLNHYSEQFSVLSESVWLRKRIFHGRQYVLFYIFLRTYKIKKEKKICNICLFWKCFWYDMAWCPMV